MGPMLWMKTSMLSISYKTMSWTQWRSGMLAILLSWYGFLQFMPGFFASARVAFKYRNRTEGLWSHTPRYERSLLVASVALLTFCLLHQAIHLFGVFWCRESHDLSITRGCNE